LKKTDGSRKFGVDFCLFCPKTSLYGFIEKQAPQKALCLGPDPPPWRKHEIYRKNTIFNDFGAFNRAGKSVSKIGIYALPPLKSEIYSKIIDILIIHYPWLNISCLGCMLRIVFSSFYFGPQSVCWLFDLNEFFFLLSDLVLIWLVSVTMYFKSDPRRKHGKPLKQGTLAESKDASIRIP
jgi:hypothetical protein